MPRESKSESRKGKKRLSRPVLPRSQMIRLQNLGSSFLDDYVEEYARGEMDEDRDIDRDDGVYRGEQAAKEMKFKDFIDTFDDPTNNDQMNDVMIDIGVTTKRTEKHLKTAKVVFNAFKKEARAR